MRTIKVKKYIIVIIFFIVSMLKLTTSEVYAGSQIQWEWGEDGVSFRFYNKSDPSEYSKDFFYKDKNGRKFTFFKNGNLEQNNLFLTKTKSANLLAGNVENMSISSNSLVSYTNLVANDSIKDPKNEYQNFVTSYTAKYGPMIPNNTVTNYGIKIGYKNESGNIQYHKIANDVLRYYTITAGADSTKPMINWNVIDGEAFNWIQDQVLNGNVPLKNGMYTIYISKIYATDITASSGYNYNYYKAGQGIDNIIQATGEYAAYENWLNFKPEVFKNSVTIMYKYKDTLNSSEYVENKSMRRQLTVSKNSSIDKMLDDATKKSVLNSSLGNKTNYNYVGVKYSISDSSSMDSLVSNIDKSSNSFGYNKKTLTLNSTKKNTVICFYYDTRPVEVNYYLKPLAGATIKLNKNQVVANGTNNLEYLGGADVDATYKYLGQTLTYKDKTYSYKSGEKIYASTLSKINNGEGTLDTFTTQTKVVGTNYYGDGNSFDSASTVQINFYYTQGVKEERNIYIRHIDLNGNIIGKNTQEKINGVVQKNGYNVYTKTTGPVPDYVSEYFLISYTDTMTITALTGSKYEYQYYKIGNGSTESQAKTNVQNATSKTGTPVNLASAVTQYTYIDLYYKPNCTGVDCIDSSSVSNIDFTGKLSFVNNPLDSSSYAYSNSTSGEDIDYIASGKSLKGYISGAYQYYFRRADYEEQKTTSSAQASITISARGSVTGLTHDSCGADQYGHTHQKPIYSGWSSSSSNSGSTSWKGSGSPSVPSGSTSELKIISYSLGSTSSSTPKPTKKNPNPETTYTASIIKTTQTRTIIGWNTMCQPFAASPSRSNSYTYTVPYEHKYYVIKNFKLYRISKVGLYDTYTNQGGILFDGGDTVYELKTSSAYESRLQGGFTNNTRSYIFNGSAYSLSDESPATCDGTSDCNSKVSSMGNRLQSRVNAVSANEAASHQNLTFTLQGKNDTFTLVNKPELFNSNNRTLIWNIRDVTNSTKTLDTTISNYPYNYEQYRTVGNATTNVSDFESAPILRIPITQVNGQRTLKAKIYYTIDTVQNRNNGTTSLNIGTNEYSTQAYEYKDNQVNKVNVLTPLTMGLNIKTDQTVNHSSKDQINLQKNATFTITPSVSSSSVAGYSNVDTNEFIKYYYVKCDFDITDVVVYGNKTESEGYDNFTRNELLRGGTWIKVPAGGYITGKATQYTETQGTTVDIQQNNIEAVGIAKNVPDLLEDYIYNSLDANMRSTSAFSSEYVDYSQIWQNSSNTLRQARFYTIKSIVSDAFHIARTTITTSNLGRIFDFKITDCADLNFKDVFRTTTGNNVNTPTGQVYFSGIKRLKMYNTSSEIGYNETEDVADKKMILPLGPYKNTNVALIDAPKLGYRVAFDLKTTGYISDASIKAGTRKIIVKPSYYYIGKDGSGYDENITLYYKNSSGKYIPFVNSSEPYMLYFKPNDGYRNLSNRSITPNSSFLSDKLEQLEISSPNGFVLNYKMLDTSGNGDNFIQTWYGEFKLPNSTIAVPNGGNINSPKTNGYIGVRFDITCVDTINGQTVTLSYNQADKSANPSTNTTQWDYDGYLGFVSPGSEASNIKLRLGSKVATLDNTMYNKIKSTVVLYDTDNRAAQDFE